jgi:hypothetical protein
MEKQATSKDAHDVHDSGSKKPSVEENARRRMQRVVELIDRQLRIITAQHTQNQPATTGSKRQTRDLIQSALTDFRTFFSDYGAYFDQPAITKNPKYTFHIIVKALDKVMPLWETLARAVSQRSNTCFDFSDDDAVAKEFLACFKSDPGCSPQKPPIIYYEKRYHITRFLFHTHPLIGIPIDMALIRSTEAADQHAPNPNREAIAHEMGHYFFWNNGSLAEYDQRMSDLRAKIAESVLGKETWGLIRSDNGTLDINASQRLFARRFASLTIWLHWVDEIVADIVGTLLCGPSYALSAQDVQATYIKRAATLFNDDGEHPMPYFRPLIALKILELTTRDDLKGELQPLLEALTKRWKDFRGNIEEHMPKPDSRGRGHGDSSEPEVTPQDLEADLAAVVTAILDARVFLKLQPNRKPLKAGAASKKPGVSNYSLRQSVVAWDQPLPGALPTREDPLDAITNTRNAIQPLPLLFVDTAEQAKQAQSIAQDEAATPVERMIPEQLKDLIAYINQRRDALKEAGTPAESEEWEQLLDLDLSRNLGHVDVFDPETNRELEWDVPAYHAHSHIHVRRDGRRALEDAYV